MAKLDGAVCLRLHQRECLLNIMHALREPTTMRDSCCKPSKFLIQHAPGSGKTLTMAALTYALINEDGDDDNDGDDDGSSSNNNNNNGENMVVVLSDRLVLDEQLARVISQYLGGKSAPELTKRTRSLTRLPIEGAVSWLPHSRHFARRHTK